MYIPRVHQETNRARLHALIRAQPLGTWVTLGEEGLIANHVPFQLDSSRGPHGMLVGHVARANPVWRAFSRTLESIVSFQGPQAYITPAWYATKAETGEVVPTWNYAVVHAHGIPRAIDDRGWLLEHVRGLTNAQEAAYANPWKAADAPPDYIERMVQAIIGIEIAVTRLEGKWKVSQNRSDADKRGVVTGLRERGDALSQQMAELVERHMGTAGEG